MATTTSPSPVTPLQPAYGSGMSQSKHPPEVRSNPLSSIGGALRTLFSNSFGSDALTAYSAEYAWLSNQMAHAMMGFFLATMTIGWVFYNPWPTWLIWLPLLLPPLKELIDYALDVGLRGRPSAPSGGEPNGRPFRLNNAELVWDAVTDVFFWWLGMILAIGLFGFSPPPWDWIAAGAAVAVAVGLLLIFRVWLPQKRMFDASRMPFNFLRLVKYPEPKNLLTPQGLEEVRKFQQIVPGAGPGQPGQHYVVIGGDPVARSELAVSLGCEFISHWKGVYHISAVKLLERPDRLDRVCRMGAGSRAAVCCLIVDDLNVSLPIPRAGKAARKAQRDQAQSDEESRVIDLVDKVDELREQFRHVTTIWVLTGQQPPPGATGHTSRVQQWEDFLRELLMPGSSDGLTVIELQPPPPPEPTP